MSSKNFFVNSGSAVSNNFVLPLMNGEDAWRQVYNQMNAAKHSINLCFWGFESNHQLIRNQNEILLGPSKRSQYTMYALLQKKKKEGVRIRILLWELPFNAGWNFSDILIRLSGAIGDLEVMYQPHPTRTIIGSWHQKTIVIDDQIGFVSGMNAKENDWDTSSHLVFDGRRAKHTLDAAARKKINVHQDYNGIDPPRRDYMALVQGPAVTAIQMNFVERWNYCIAEKCHFHDKVSKMAIPTLNQPFSDVKAQITRTLPKYKVTPRGEYSISDSYINAIRLAETYIYIEDQYFRSQVLAAELVKALVKNRKLIIIVVTQPDYLSEIEPEESWKVATPSTYWTNKAFETITKSFPEFMLFYLQSSAVIKGKRVFKTVNIHSKIMIVDDEFYTIGSANVNERSFEYDGELNIAVHHGSAKDFRKKVFSNILQTTCPDDINQAARLWYNHASSNHRAFKTSSQPKSLVYPFNQKGPLIPLVPNDWN